MKICWLYSNNKGVFTTCWISVGTRFTSTLVNCAVSSFCTTRTHFLLPVVIFNQPRSAQWSGRTLSGPPEIRKNDGRQRSAEKALSRLNSEYFLFLGFSGSDLLTNPDYLGFDDLSRTVKGACYVAWPHAREIGEGAKALIGKFGTKAHVITEDVAPFLDALSIQLGCEAFAPDQSGELEDGRTLFRKKLVRWANGVSFPKALICVSALLESGGEGERAARRLDRAVRRASTIENVSHPDWPLVAFHNGRAGVSLGRFVNVPDASGNESNASAYSVNSLLHGAAALGMRGTIHMPTAGLGQVG
jgi:hypothetical protein